MEALQDVHSLTFRLVFLCLDSLYLNTNVGVHFIKLTRLFLDGEFLVREAVAGWTERDRTGDTPDSRRSWEIDNVFLVRTFFLCWDIPVSLSVSSSLTVRIDHKPASSGWQI